MSEQLPEHIDQIEEFYQKSLKDFGKEPSADLWAKIDAKMPVVSLETSPTQSNIQNKYIIGTVGVSAVIGLALYLFLSQNKEKQKNSEIEEKDTLEVRMPEKNASSGFEQLNTSEVKSTTPPNKKVAHEDLKLLEKSNRNINQTNTPVSSEDNNNNTKEASHDINEDVVNEKQIEKIVEISKKQELDSSNNINKKKSLQDKLKEKSTLPKNDLFIKKEE